MLAVFSSMIAMIFMLFYNGILAVYLRDVMGIDESYIGKIFLINNII